MTNYPVRWRTWSLLVAAMLLVVAGCTADDTETTEPATESPGRIDLPYNPDPPKEAKIFAVLVGDPAVDGGCVWLRQGTVEFGVLWPEGFSADFNPVRLYNGDSLVAKEGDELELTGSFAPDAAVFRPHRCVIGTDLWLAGQVRNKS